MRTTTQTWAIQPTLFTQLYTFTSPWARHFFPPSSTERVTMPSGTTRTQAKVAAAN